MDRRHNCWQSTCVADSMVDIEPLAVLTAQAPGEILGAYSASTAGN
jgi:hypothetical protein